MVFHHVIRGMKKILIIKDMNSAGPILNVLVYVLQTMVLAYRWS